MQPSLLFLTLKVFSATGGIEKLGRVAARALAESCHKEGLAFSLFSAYDRPVDCDARYLSPAQFKGFGGRRGTFVKESIRRGRRAKLVLLSHINLLPVGYAIKKLSPCTRLVLIVHGIEVWSRQPAWKRRLLLACDRFLAVSQFTAQTMGRTNDLAEEKFEVVNNGLDPFLPSPASEREVNRLRERYGLAPENKVVLTLTRLSSAERYKGYDRVLMAIKSLKKSLPEIRYLLVGRYDAEEKARLDRLVRQQGLSGEVIFTGFVPESELAAHYALADVYAMPSRGEGFGIVFTEALWYGLPVIAGNCDGSVDALAKGALGTLVDPGSTEELTTALSNCFHRGKTRATGTRDVQNRFGFPAYKKALWASIQPLLKGEMFGASAEDWSAIPKQGSPGKVFTDASSTQ